MNRDDIIRMARDCGWTPFESLNKSFEHFFHLAYAAGRKAEQDRCAKIADAHATIEGIAQAIAAEIRSDK